MSEISDQEYSEILLSLHRGDQKIKEEVFRRVREAKKKTFTFTSNKVKEIYETVLLEQTE